MDRDVANIISALELVPLPQEGGFFRETYRDSKLLPCSLSGPEYDAERSLTTAIYFLITRDNYSALHRVRGVEIFHHYAGDSVEMFIADSGVAKVVRLGRDILAGERPQVVVPAGAWQGSRLVNDGLFALLGTTMAPGFDFNDFSIGDSHDLIEKFPEHRAMLSQLHPIASNF